MSKLCQASQNHKLTTIENIERRVSTNPKRNMDLCNHCLMAYKSEVSNQLALSIMRMLRSFNLDKIDQPVINVAYSEIIHKQLEIFLPTKFDISMSINPHVQYTTYGLDAYSANISTLNSTQFTTVYGTVSIKLNNFADDPSYIFTMTLDENTSDNSLSKYIELHLENYISITYSVTHADSLAYSGIAKECEPLAKISDATASCPVCSKCNTTNVCEEYYKLCNGQRLCLDCMFNIAIDVIKSTKNSITNKVYTKDMDWKQYQRAVIQDYMVYTNSGTVHVIVDTKG